MSSQNNFFLKNPTDLFPHQKKQANSDRPQRERLQQQQAMMAGPGQAANLLLQPA